jgi:hypothetical protein
MCQVRETIYYSNLTHERKQFTDVLPNICNIFLPCKSFQLVQQLSSNQKVAGSIPVE